MHMISIFVFFHLPLTTSKSYWFMHFNVFGNQMKIIKIKILTFYDYVHFSKFPGSGLFLSLWVFNFLEICVFLYF